MPLEKKWYGMTEFAIADPDGYVVRLCAELSTRVKCGALW